MLSAHASSLELSATEHLNGWPGPCNAEVKVQGNTCERSAGQTTYLTADHDVSKISGAAIQLPSRCLRRSHGTINADQVVLGVVVGRGPALQE